MAEPTTRLINRDFRLLWAGQFASGFGDTLFETTLVVWIVTGLGEGRSWAPLMVSALLTASAVPIMIAGPLAGVLVDRWPDKRRVMLRSDLASAAAIAVMLPASGTVRLPGLPIPPLEFRIGSILLIVAFASIVVQFFRPASGIVVRDIVPEPAWPRAIGALQSARSATLLAGPAIAAPLLVAVGPAWALLANMISFIVSYACVQRMRVPLHPAVNRELEPAFGRELHAGIGYFIRSRLLITITMSLAIAVFGLGAINALDVFFVTENLGAPASVYGLISASYGIGMLGGALLAPAIVLRVGEERSLYLVLAGLAVLAAVYSRLTNPVPAVLVIIGMGLAIPSLNVAIGPLIMRATPREMQGRIGGLIDPVITAASIGGMLTGGMLYASLLGDFERTLIGFKFGPIDTIYSGMALFVFAGAVYAWTRLRSAGGSTD